MTKARDISKLLSTANGKIAGENLDVSFENITDTGTEGTKVATGTTAQRGSTAGQIRFNSTTGLAEYYDGSQFKSIDSPPTISSIDVTEVDSNAGGNQTIVITGGNFASGATVTFIGNSGTDFDASTVTVDSVSQITAVAPKSSFLNAQEPYGVKVVNISGLSATLASQINVDTSPSWQTASGNIGSVEEGSSANFTVSATDPDGDTVSYSETTSVLSGTGLTLNSSTGAITGTANSVSGDTTDTFTLRATANSKTADRQFNIIRTEIILDGSTQAKANTSASAIKTLTNTTTSGLYWINVGGTPRQIYCDMSGFNSTGYMLMATMKDMQSGWSGNTSSASTATNNINNYTNWGYDSNWWTSATGEADIVADDYNFTNNRDYKSYLWSNYQVDNTNLDAIYLVNGNALNTTAKRVRVGGSFTSSTLVNVFNGTTSIGADNANNNNTGSGWNFNGGSGTGTNHGTAVNTKNINVGRNNWVYGYYRIAGYSSSDSVLYGSSIASGAGLKYVYNNGTDVGAVPAHNYTMNSNYTTGISMTLWVK